MSVVWTDMQMAGTFAYDVCSPEDGVLLFAVNGTGSYVLRSLDGTVPTTASAMYTGPIRISLDTTIKAVSYLDGVYSEVAVASYTLQGADYKRIPSYSDALLPLLLQQYQRNNP